MVSSTDKGELVLCGGGGGGLADLGLEAGGEQFKWSMGVPLKRVFQFFKFTTILKFTLIFSSAMSVFSLPLKFDLPLCF